MHLSAERIALADRAIQRAVEQASVAWRSIPRWETGDPAQVLVRSDVVRTLDDPPEPADGASPDVEPPFGAPPLEVETLHVRFRMTLAQVTSPTPDALLSAVTPRAVRLARRIDDRVLTALVPPIVEPPKPSKASKSPQSPQPWWLLELDPAAQLDGMLGPLLDGRRVVEDNGYRAPSCLIAGDGHFHGLNRFADELALERLLTAAGANSLRRAAGLDGPDGRTLMLLLGRRQQIADGNAGTASPGEEPVDIAVSVAPSLEVVGETADGGIDLALRARFATRVKDRGGVVVFHGG